MNLHAGAILLIDRPSWPDIDVEERTPENARWSAEIMRVVGCEWIGPHQRMVVRLQSMDHGYECCLTRHELEINGAAQ